MRDPNRCPDCNHIQHLPGTECPARVDHGPSNFHVCLCLARPGAALACPPQMTCQGGTLGYADIWYLQRGHSLSSADGVISPEVLHVNPAGRDASKQPASTALSWAESVASHGAGDSLTIDIDVQVPGESEPRPMELPIAAARELHAMLGDAIGVRPAEIQECQICGAGYTYGQRCSTCLFRAEMAADAPAS